MYNPVSCLNPRIVRNKFTHDLVSVPCGKCSACQTRSSSLWTARLREESTCHAYTLFGTLTYDDSHLPLIDLDNYPIHSDSLFEAVAKSQDYIKFCGNKIPCLSVKDIQKFFKRLRSKITYNHGTQETNIRYFLAGEYGPTTFRPHYHFLLWFDSPDLVPTIKSYIYQAWKSKTNCKSLSAFLRRNKLSFVHGHAEQYVAGYLNKSTQLPPLLSEKPFRTWHVQSSCPPIGTIRILKESMEALLDGDVNQVTLHRLSTGDAVVVPLWRGLENRCFPKCIGFSRVSHADRVSLYSISCLFGEEGFNDFRTFSERFLPQWFSSGYPYSLIRSLCGDSSSLDFPDDCCISSLHRLFNISRQAIRLAETLGLSLTSFVERIETYYSRREYLSLVEQIRFQEYLSNSPRRDECLSQYPMLIDQLFYENLRDLPFDTYCSYLEQFGLGNVNDVLFIPQNTQQFSKRKSLADKVWNDTHKVRIKKDYVANHPECFLNYRSLLRPYCLT